MQEQQMHPPWMLLLAGNERFIALKGSSCFMRETGQTWSLPRLTQIFAHGKNVILILLQVYSNRTGNQVLRVDMNMGEQLELMRKEEEKEQQLGVGGRTEGGEEEVQSDTINPENAEPSLIGASKPRIASNGRRNPPARNTSRFWFERFLAVIQRQNPSVIDSSFLSQVAPNNEGKLLAQLKYLHVIDDQGKPTPLLPGLNMVGAEQNKAFRLIVQEAYGDLTSEIVIERAVPDDVVNFFIRKYAFTRDKAINAAKFFVYLAEKGALSISPELASFPAEKSAGTSPQASPSTGSVVATASQRASERNTRPYSTVAGTQKRKRNDGSQQPAIQTVINIKLDKDTPREYWDRVLALIGEGKSEQIDTIVSAESETTKNDNPS